MFRIDLPGTDTHLSLEPRLANLPLAAQVAILAVPLLMALFVIKRLYRAELRLASRGLARALLALRLMITAAVVLLLLLRPQYGYTGTEPEPSFVLIALDRSGSMEVTDPQRPPAEAVELARGLDLAADLAAPRRMDEWVASLRAGGSVPDGDRPALESVQARVAGLTRKQLLERVLFAPGGDLLARLAEGHAVRVVGFHQQISELPSEAVALRAALASPAGPAELTDLGLPLSQAVPTGSGAQPLGVVLLTDGRHNAGGSPVPRAVELGQRGVPVFPVLIGSPTPPTDVAVASIQGTSTVFQHTDAYVEARVLVSNMPAGPIRVTLSWPPTADGPKREPLAETIRHDGTTRLYPVRFQARMDRAGLETLTVAVEPGPGRPADAFPENDRRSFAVRVAPDKARVLLVDGAARWECRYLASALARDPTMEVRSVLFEQPRIDALTDEALAAGNYPARKLPESTDGLFGFDCIVLGDVSPDDLSIAGRERLERYVAERGGTLVLVAGKRSLPVEYLRRSNDAAHPDPIVKLLPIREPRIVAPENGFRLTLSAEGNQTAFLNMEPEAAESQRRWASLPRHYWAIAGRAKEGAVPLAFYPDGSAADPSGTRERENALIVRQNVGFGRVLYVGIDSTWRWRFRAGDVYHHRFWGQVIRWAASDRPLVTGNELARFGAREPVYRPGQPVEFLVRLGEQARPLAPDALAGMRVLRAKPGGTEEVVSLVSLKVNPGQSRELAGELRDLPPGDYEAEPVIPELEGRLVGPDGKKLRSPFRVTEPEAGERVDLSTNPALLEELAARSGGRVFTADKAGDLVEMLASRSATRSVPRRIALAHSGWTVLVLLALLTAEWLLRKRAGLI